MNKEEWIKYNSELIGGNDRTALHDYFDNRWVEIIYKLGKAMETSNTKSYDYISDIVSRLSAYEVFLLRLNKIEMLKTDDNPGMNEATDKDIKALIGYEVQQFLPGSKAFNKYKRDPHGLDR